MSAGSSSSFSARKNKKLNKMENPVLAKLKLLQDLEKVKSNRFIKKLCELEENAKFRILKFDHHKTTYGEKLIVFLENGCKYWVPQIYNEQAQHLMQITRNDNIFLKYKGKSSSTGYKLEFSIGGDDDSE